MKSLIALVSVLSLSVPALADGGRISDQSLAKMGLSGMKAMSDVNGTQIRGLSATVGGYSLASSGGAAAINGYQAHGGHSAVGADISVAASSGFGVVVSGGISKAH